MSRILLTPNVENVRFPGQILWFEYHCLESHQSCDAEIWYRSHQQVEVLGVVDNDGYDVFSQQTRFEQGIQLIYRVRFKDGLEWDVFEDELLDDPGNFQRPAPPKKPEKQ